MKFRLLVVVLSTMGCAQLACAAGGPDQLGLGALQGVYDTCSKVDPEHGRKYGELERDLYKGMSEKAIGALQSSRAFVSGRETLHKVLAELAKPDLIRGCEEILRPGDDRKHDRDDDRKRDRDDK